MEVEDSTSVTAASAMEILGGGGGGMESGTAVPGSLPPNLTQVNQQNSVTFRTLHQNLNVAYASRPTDNCGGLGGH